jgi:pimeloyl-ACP methyl ester carboxylesterase
MDQPQLKAPLDALFRGVEEERRLRFLEIERSPLKSLAVAGRTIRYLDRGKGSRTILLLPGLLGDSRALYQQTLGLETDFRILSPEYVLSPRVDDQVEALAAILDAEGVDRVEAVVGQTLGGYLSQYLTRRFPERIENLVLVHADLPRKQQLPDSEKTARSMRWTPWFLTRRRLHGILIRMVERWAVEPGHDRAQAALIRAIFAHRFSNLLDKKTTVVRYELLADIFRQANLLDTGLPNWQGRVLVIYSENNVFSHHLAELQKRLPRVEIRSFGKDHNVSLLLEPDETVRLVREFLGNGASEAI